MNAIRRCDRHSDPGLLMEQIYFRRLEKQTMSVGGGKSMYKTITIKTGDGGWGAPDVTQLKNAAKI